jgi:dTDP-4-amino-4,6-dideoxygalactose transaminase
MQELCAELPITDVACALRLSQLKRLPSFLDCRRSLAAYYEQPLVDLVS